MRKLWSVPQKELDRALAIEGGKVGELICGKIGWHWLNDNSTMGIPNAIDLKKEFHYFGKVKFTKTLHTTQVKWTEFNVVYTTDLIRHALRILQARIVHVYIYKPSNFPILMLRRGKKIIMLAPRVMDDGSGIESEYGEEITTLWDRIPDNYKLIKMVYVIGNDKLI